MKTFGSIARISCALLILMVCPASTFASESLTLTIHGEDIAVRQYRAAGKQLVLYVAPGYGFSDRSTAMAQTLADLGIEVWMVDLADNFFLPRGNRSIRTFDGRYVAGLIEQAHRDSGKNVTLLSSSFGALPVLKGARQWQLANRNIEKSYLNGAILFSPELYRAIPPLGVDPEFEPIATATNIPIMIYQSELRNNRWQLDSVMTRLKQGGATVFHKIMPGVTGFFYEIDSLPATQKALKEVPLEFPRVISLLEVTPTPLAAVDMKTVAQVDSADIDIELKKYKGKKSPLSLDLVDITGKRVVRKDFKNRVTVVNFWATWCPPCIQEIPSLNRLSGKMKGQKFELLSVNFGEDKAQIRKFLQRVDVAFPVLLDHEGKVAGRWNTVVLPSTFVIGPDGEFAYAVNAAIEWDNPGVVNALKQLATK